MSLVQFKQGKLAGLGSAAITPGTFYVVTDERAIYLDVDASTRVRIGDFQEFDSITALNANPNPSTSALYYVKDINVLAKYDGQKYVQINTDTGATSVEVVGEGNAVTDSSYDPSTRKLTLTKGKTFLESADLSEIEGDIKDLEGRVQEVEGDIETLEALVGEDSIEDQISDAIEGLADVYETKASAKSTKEALEGEIAKKQDTIAFEGEYDAETNKAATMSDVETAVAGLSGAMHWRGVVESVPEGSESGKYVSGDVVSVGTIEYAFNGTAWVELGDESSKHTHTNKDDLDKVTGAKITSWDDAASKAHVHDNIDELDLIEDGDVAKWNAAEAKAHTHSNIDELAKFVTGDKDKLDTAASTASANADAIEGILDGDDIDSFSAVEEALEGKQDTIPENTYDAYGDAAQALDDAKGYVDTKLTWGTF